MRIVADRDLYRVNDLFAGLGKLELLPGREISQSHLQNADVLLVRSVTNITKELLENTPVRFVGTATSGIDHVDADYLLDQGIQLAHARGSNANAVVDYCFAVLAELGLLGKRQFQEISVGIVGYGAVGSCLARKLSNLGVAIKLCDPPLQEISSDSELELRQFSSLAEIAKCDVVSLHTSLVNQGAHPSAGLVDAEFLAALKRESVLINTSRGGVINEKDVLAYSRERNEFTFVADVWAGEPDVNSEIVNVAKIATPHIAGYSSESKFAAVNMLRESLIEFIGTGNTQAEILIAEESNKNCLLKQIDSLPGFLARGFSLHQIDGDLRAAVNAGKAVNYFDAARKQLIARREYSSFVLVDSELDEFDKKVLTELGVKFQ